VVQDSQGDWLQDALHVPSPNYDERPAGVDISLLVVHGISLPPGEFGGPWIDQLFTNQLESDAHPYFREIADLRVSSHLLIRRDGRLVQYVPFSKRAWHAGPSCFQGREACNDFSIGIELEGDDCASYTDLQYTRLAHIVRDLRETFPAITPERIVGHCDIAPERKTDPGPAFDWERLHQLIALQGAIAP
jgi:AmpD protein